jgi:glycosyltransferase involved in cell wall biosynthesis
MTLVSIITPSFNQAEFLEQTIRSVLTQDYEPIEYMIIDGGSSDGSLEIIQKYTDQLAWWVSEGDAGQADAINKGFARASGEIVAWLNSDDLFLPGAIRQAATALSRNPDIGMVYGDAITVDSQDNKLNDLIFRDWGLADLMCFRIICQPAVFMRRSILEQAGYLDLNYHYMLDHQLWLRIAQCAPIMHISSTLAAARHHPEAKNVDQAPGFGEEALRLLKWMEDQPEFAPKVASNRRNVEAGAYRLNGRYLLDGDQPVAALKSYGQALVRNPRFTLQHWHRMVYAILCLAGGKGLAGWYYRIRRRLRRGDNLLIT